jgi:hypothetical protein
VKCHTSRNRAGGICTAKQSKSGLDICEPSSQSLSGNISEDYKVFGA